MVDTIAGMWTRRDLLKGITGVVACARAQTSADTVYVNGDIITLDASGRVTAAVAVRDGKVLVAGSEAVVRAAVARNARIVDLRGRALLPGLYAAHDHFPSWGTVTLFQVDLNSPPIGRIETMADVIAALRTRAKETPPGEWIVGRGYDDTLLREQRHPNRHDLDQASTEHPIWIVHSSGTSLGAANSRALVLAGIDRNTPPSKQGGQLKSEPGIVVHNRSCQVPDCIERWTFAF